MVLLSNYPVYFVFDGQNDRHYTDTLLELGPEAYLWHEIRRQQKADIILFASCQNKETVVRTFDSVSAQFLAPQNFLGGFLNWLSSGGDTEEDERVSPCTCRLSELEQKLRDPFPQWLKKHAAGRSGQTIALVVSHDVFSALNRNGQITDLPENCILLIRLVMKTEELEKALLTERTLSEAFPEIANSLRGCREPLISVLKRQLGEQMIRLDDQESDARNMLLRQAFAAKEPLEPLKDLEDQAALLHLCRQYRRMSLIDPDFRDDGAAAQGLSEVFKRPDASKFRGSLRRCAADLRQRHPARTMADALRTEGLISAMPPDGLTYQDELSKNIMDLSLPADFPQKYACSAALEQAKQDLSTLWNRSRNQAVCEAANLFCASARTAIAEKDWDTLSSALELVAFCGKQVCIGTDHNQNLDQIFDLGKDVIRRSRYLAGKKNVTYTDYDKIIHRAIDDRDQKELEALKACLRDDIHFFEKPEIPAAVVQSHLERSVERKRQALSRIEADIQAAQQREQEAQLQAEQQRRDEQIRQKYMIDDTPAPRQESYDPEKGRRSAERILQRNFIPL